MVRSFDEGKLLRGVCVVRRDFNLGKIDGIGSSEDRVGRSVEVRSREWRDGKERRALSAFDSWETREEMGLWRSDSLSSFGRLVSGAMSHNDTILLEDRSNVVRCGAGNGTCKVLKPFDERLRTASERNWGSSRTIWVKR